MYMGDSDPSCWLNKPTIFWKLIVCGAKNITSQDEIHLFSYRISRWVVYLNVDFETSSGALFSHSPYMNLIYDYTIKLFIKGINST